MHVKVYSRDNCSYCVRAKDFFKKKNIAFEEFKVGIDITSEEYAELTNMKTVPAIIIDNQLIGGYTDLVEYAINNMEKF